MAKAKSTLALAGEEMAGLFGRLKGKDRQRACEFARTAMGRLRRGYYRTPAELRAEGQAALLGPKAIDKEGLLAFLSGLVDLAMKLIPLFVKV
jgi:hypothetical protein